MNYDVWKPTTSLTAGPNSPLNDSCAAPQDRNGSAVSAVRAWNAAGIPLNNIVLGVAGYGHSFNVSPANAYQPPGGAGSELALFPPFNATGQPPGDAWDNPPGMDACGNPVGQGGIWQFWGLVQAGYLKSDGTPTSEVVYRYDNCSQTVSWFASSYFGRKRTFYTLPALAECWVFFCSHSRIYTRRTRRS